MNVTLRDYQLDERGVGGIRDAFRAGFRAPLYVLSTGGGKTVVFCYMAANAVRHGRRVVIVVHRKELLRQTSRSLRAIGIDHGIIAPGFTPHHHALVQVASVNTLAGRLKAGKAGAEPAVLIIDEAHHSNAGTWGQVLTAWRNAKLIGVTATPIRLDGQGLGAIFDCMILGPTMHWLIANGYLCDPITYAPPIVADLTKLHRRGGDFKIEEVEERIDTPTITGDAVDHYRRICPGEPALAFCVTVRHAQHVAEKFTAAGFKFFCLDGKTNPRERDRLIAGLGSRDGSVDGITTCEIVSEGTDIPVVTAAIGLRPSDSVGLYLQQCGRVLRPVFPAGADLSTAEGRLAAIARSSKPRAILLDHVGNTLRHGLVDDDRQWSLEGRPKKKGGPRDAMPVLAMRQCQQCFAAHRPAPSCPVCGWVYPAPTNAPKQVDGELRPVSAEEVNAERARRLAADEAARTPGAIKRATTREELELIRRARGYKPGWVDYVMRERERNGATRPIRPHAAIAEWKGER